MEPLISVIVPVYNASKFLVKCINSISNQEYKNLEIIAIDDGSQDDSLSVLKALANKDDRIIVLNKKNKKKRLPYCSCC